MDREDHNQRPLKRIIQEMMRQYQMEDKYYEVSLNKAWERLMGESIANRTKRLRLKEGILYIHLNSSALREELSYGREKIRQRMNGFLGRDLIDEVRL